MQDYHPDFVPFSWRGWWDFGTGALGDMACHVMDPAFKALKLRYPDAVEASTVVQYQKMWNRADYSASCPQASVIHFDFPAREGMPPVTLHWYDGGMMPRRPVELKDDEPMGNWDGGVIFEGSKGKIMCEVYGRNPKLLPTKLMKDFKKPDLNEWFTTINGWKEEHPFEYDNTGLFCRKKTNSRYVPAQEAG